MNTFNFLYTHAKKQWSTLLITMIAMLALVGVELVAPWIIKTMIGIIEDGVEPGDTALIGRLAVAALIAYTARMGLRFLRSYMAHLAGWAVVADVRKLVYRHLQRLSLQFYADKQTGQLMSRTVNDTDLIESLVSHAIPDVTVNLFTFLGVALVLLTMNWKLMVMCLLPIPLIVVGMRAFSKHVRPAFRRRQEQLGELNARLNDNLSGIREIKVFTQEENEAHAMGVRIERYMASLLHALKLMAIFQPFVEFAASLGSIVLIYFGGRLVLQMELSVEDLVGFFLYLSLLYQPIRVLGGSWEQVQNALAGVDRVSELLEEDPEVEDDPDAITIAGRSRGDMEFRDVSFQYIEGIPVLENIDLKIPSGSSVALVGPTGVGKSTMASLIPRFYDPTSGIITLDGHDIRDIHLKDLRSQMSMVLQDVFLFHGSVRENILFGKPSADEKQMMQAAEAANAHGFISELPEGYDTLIGERGVKLSGGQKQRLAIARAVLADTPILILDEATSSVDTETEILIQEALDRLMQGRTTVVIAHRLSTIRKADNIVVLEKSRIVQSGTHEELIESEGRYRMLSTAAG